MAVLDDRDLGTAAGERMYGQAAADGVVVGNQNLHSFLVCGTSEQGTCRACKKTWGDFRPIFNRRTPGPVRNVHGYVRWAHRGRGALSGPRRTTAAACRASSAARAARQ